MLRRTIERTRRTASRAASRSILARDRGWWMSARAATSRAVAGFLFFWTFLLLAFCLWFAKGELGTRGFLSLLFTGGGRFMELQ